MQTAKNSLLGGGIGFGTRFLLLGLIMAPTLLFTTTLPSLRAAQNNTHTPQPLDWQAVKNNRADRVHNYVTATGTLSETVLEYGSKNDPYEILYDAKTGVGILVDHYGKNPPPRQTATPNASVTGMLDSAPRLIRQLPATQYPKLNRTYRLIQNKHPSTVGAQVGWLIVELGVFLVSLFFAYRSWIAPRLVKAPAPQSGPAGATDWQKFRLDQ